MKLKPDHLLVFFFGIVAGAAGTFCAGFLLIRSNLIIQTQVPLSFDKAAIKIRPAAASVPGWIVSEEICALPSAPNGRRVRNFKLCKREYAEKILSEETDRKVAAILPCTVSLYEDDAGNVFYSKLNLPFFGFLLGGNAGKVLRREITPEQNAILFQLSDK